METVTLKCMYCNNLFNSNNELVNHIIEILLGIPQQRFCILIFYVHLLEKEYLIY